jgi:hypothetical protein
MEDLLENFSKHISKIISSKLGSKIRNLSRATTNYKTDEDYSRVESNIQMLIESYLSNLKDNDYQEIANNIFNSFVEEDDKNLIRAIKFFIRTYEHYQELNLRKKFFKWRKTSLKLKIINSLVVKELNLRKDKNIYGNNTNNNSNNNINKNKINGLRYNDNEDEVNINFANNIGENVVNNNKMNDYNKNVELNYNYMDYDNCEQEKNGFDNQDIVRNKKMENIEDFINQDNENNQQYQFNYGNIGNINNNNNDYKDYKEEFNEELELDVNKLYSKNNFN